MVRSDHSQADLRYDLWGGTSGSYAGLDRFSRVTDLQWVDPSSSTTLAELKHGYDRNSNRLYREDTVAEAASADFDELYSYDKLNRLTDMQRGLLDSSNTSITTETFEQHWGLDAVGNWSIFNQDNNGDGTFDLQQTRSHSTVNEISDITESAGTSWVTPGYDNAGNMTSGPTPGSESSANDYTYDAWNRMVEVTDGTNTLAVYVFDGAGRRIIEKSYSGGTLSETRYVYYSSQWQRLEIRVGGTSSSDLERQYIWGVRYVDDLVQRERDTNGDGTLDETLYAAQDANFRVVALVDTSGAVVERYTYDPYGTRIILDSSFASRSSSSYETRIGHQGLYHDPESGLVENRHRMLHPSLGRFMQRDPMGYLNSILSLYTYVGSRPTKFTDRYGLKEQEDKCDNHDIDLNVSGLIEQMILSGEKADAKKKRLGHKYDKTTTRGHDSKRKHIPSKNGTLTIGYCKRCCEDGHKATIIKASINASWNDRLYFPPIPVAEPSIWLQLSGSFSGSFHGEEDFGGCKKGDSPISGNLGGSVTAKVSADLGFHAGILEVGVYGSLGATLSISAVTPNTRGCTGQYGCIRVHAKASGSFGVEATIEIGWWEYHWNREIYKLNLINRDLSMIPIG